MRSEESLQEVLRNWLQHSDLPFHEFMELALYHSRFGYYSRPQSPVGKGGDYITAPLLSPVFAFALGRLIDEFLSRSGDEVSQVVDIGCGDGTLINSVATGRAGSFAGVDRSLARARPTSGVTFVRSLAEVPPAGARLVISNELFDALPFARVVRRQSELHELTVTRRGDALDWSERVADPRYVAYFAERSIALEDGQFADVSLDWAAKYGEICHFAERGLIVTFDYGYPEAALFRSRGRRFGTAAAYSSQRVSRDLLANPGEQDLTAHINFSDLIRAGESLGFSTLFFDRQATFLLSLGIAEHALFAAPQEQGSVEANLALLNARDDARRLVLPDGIGEDIRVLVQARGIPLEGWSFQRRLF